MTRALVLGGGGPVGIAWESGLISGLARSGVDLGAADFVQGTSAGAVVGARLACGVAADRLAEAVLDPASAEIRLPQGGSPEAFGRMVALITEAHSGTRNPAEVRRELGALALSIPTEPEENFLDIIGRELGDIPRQGWPARDFACAAADVEDGGFEMWRASSGVDLLPAVTSSCSVPGLAPPISLKGRRYMDGGVRSATNADLAAGFDLVVVLAVIPPGAERFAGLLNEEVESLKAGGSTVVTITPDEGSAAAFGPNAMDPSRKPHVARAALEQGARQAAVLREFWA